MNNITNEPKKKVGRPKLKPLTDEEKRIRKNRTNRLQREYYKRNITLNPTKIRAYTKEQNKRKKIIKQRQALLQTEQRTNKTESKKEVQGKNEE
tara:strand:+ start:1151 stop:1432 length:282 start_codon:yes stop_codon:yes gene_type:complete